MARGDLPSERVSRNIFRRRQQEAEPEVDAERVQSVAKTVGDVGIQAANQEELMEKIAASGRAPESFDIFTARSGASFAIPSEQFSADMQAGLKDMGFFQSQVASAEEAVAPAGAEAVDSFQGDGGFSYTFEPETGNYVITAAPEQYAHLTGVTVRPGSNAYDSIQAEHQTGKSLYQAEAKADTAERRDTDGDGVSDRDERRDTDGDGVTDYDEVTAGTDPLAAADAPAPAEEMVSADDPVEEYDVFNPPGAERRDTTAAAQPAPERPVSPILGIEGQPPGAGYSQATTDEFFRMRGGAPEPYDESKTQYPRTDLKDIARRAIAAFKGENRFSPENVERKRQETMERIRARQARQEPVEDAPTYEDEDSGLQGNYPG